MNGHLLPLLLGWLLGLLAPAITDQIKRVRSIDRIKAAIREELRAHALRMTIANFRIDEMFGQLDREKLQRIRGVYAKHGRSVKHDSLANLVEQMLGYTDEAIAAAMAKKAEQKATGSSGLGLQRNELPYLSSKIAEFGEFSEEKQRELFDILEQTKQFNSFVDQSIFWLRQTFSGTDADKKKSALNTDMQYQCASKKATQVAESVLKFLSNNS